MKMTRFPNIDVRPLQPTMGARQKPKMPSRQDQFWVDVFESVLHVERFLQQQGISLDDDPKKRQETLLSFCKALIESLARDYSRSPIERSSAQKQQKVLALFYIESKSISDIVKDPDLGLKETRIREILAKGVRRLKHCDGQTYGEIAVQGLLNPGSIPEILRARQQQSLEGRRAARESYRVYWEGERAAWNAEMKEIIEKYGSLENYLKADSWERLAEQQKNNKKN